MLKPAPSMGAGFFVYPWLNKPPRDVGAWTDMRVVVSMSSMLSSVGLVQRIKRGDVMCRLVYEVALRARRASV
jgi:hypothetical protein